MKKIITAIALVSMSTLVSAAPIQFSVSTNVNYVEGSYVDDVQLGHTITGIFIVDTDVVNAGPESDPNPSNVPGHEYTAFWEFTGSPYDASVFNVDLGGGFNTIAPPHLVMNDGLAITSDDTGGMVADGTYDWIELNASSTVDYCPEPSGICVDDQLLPADGEEWILAIFSDASWFTGGADIPSTLPATYTAFIIGVDIDELGEEIGLVLAPVASVSVAAVPIPAAVWLFGSAVVGLVVTRRCV